MDFERLSALCDDVKQVLKVQPVETQNTLIWGCVNLKRLFHSHINDFIENRLRASLRMIKKNTTLIDTFISKLCSPMCI